MCKVLGVARSSYYDWLSRTPRKLQAIHTRKVCSIFVKSKRTYGSPRITDELNDQGITISKSTVARIMKGLGVQARPRRKFIHTTDSKHDFKVFENILNRNFESQMVNRKWVSDITYIKTKLGWVYLTVVIDLADRMVIGWTVSENMSALSTTVASLKIAFNNRKVTDDLLIHSDRGVQYCCAEFRNLVLKTKYAKQSMSRKGNCWDNAPAESFFKTLKVEWTNKHDYQDIFEARKSIFDYIERWYNTQRKHSTLQYLSPLQKFNLLTRRAA